MKLKRIRLNPRAFAAVSLAAALAFTAVYPVADQSVFAQTTTVDICDRTEQIEEAILRAIDDNTGSRPACDAVTTAQLEAIDLINVSGSSTGSQVTSLKSGDLSGLTNITSFSAANSKIGTIPAGFFDANTNLTSMDLAVAQLTTLPAGIFDQLTSLTTLRLERNFFSSMPPGLSATSMEKLTNLWTFTIGMDWPSSGHFQTLPSGWIESLPTGLTELKLGHIRLSDADAQYIAENFTKLSEFTFDYQDLTFANFTALMDALVDISTTTATMTELHMTASGDALSGCTTATDPSSIGGWYSDNPTEIEAFKTALSGLRVTTLRIYDPKITAVAAEDILGAIDKSYPAEVHFECGSMEGFAGSSLSGYTNLKRLLVRHSDLNVGNFRSIVSNLNTNNIPITTLNLEGNDFDEGGSYIDLALFDFSDIQDTLTGLKYGSYFSCRGPWIADYEEAGFWLLGGVYSLTPGQQPKPFIAIEPTPIDEPEDCTEPVAPQEQQALEGESEPNWPPATIMNIEPAITAVRIRPGDEVVLSTEVYGMQGILDNDLADAAPPDDVWFNWEGETFSSEFAESTKRPMRINQLPDDRETLYTAPDRPGNYLVSVNVPHAARCKGPRKEIGETEAEALARCTAEFEISVRRPLDFAEEADEPVNPSGAIPASVMNSRGGSCPVFTPVEGGTVSGVYYSISAQPGAVQDETAVGICVDKSGPASNAGMTRQRYTLHGDLYSLTAFDINGRRLSKYQFNFPIETCIPLPDELRGRLSDAEMMVINRDKSLTALGSKTTFAQVGIRTCGAVGELPVVVAIGVKGAPPPLPESVEILPDTGGASIPELWVMFAIIPGIAVFMVLMVVVRYGRHRS